MESLLAPTVTAPCIVNGGKKENKNTIGFASKFVLLWKTTRNAKNLLFKNLRYM